MMTRKLHLEKVSLRKLLVIAVVLVLVIQGAVLFLRSIRQKQYPRPPITRITRQEVVQTRWFGVSEYPKGYLLYMNAWGQWNNHRRQFLDAAAVARALNRVLVVPPFEGHDRFVRKIRKNIDFYYNRTILNELGPILTVDEYLEDENAPREPWLFTGPSWGKAVVEAAQRVLRTYNISSSGFDKVVDVETGHWYGGMLNTEWVQERLGNGKYDHLPLIAFTYIFSQFAFQDEPQVFANIRSHLVLDSRIQHHARDFLRNMRSKYDVIVSAHLRRDDYKGFCNKDLYDDCHPNTELVINRLKQVIAEKYPEQSKANKVGVYLATNAPADEIATISAAIPNIERFVGSDDVLREFDEEHRCVMLIDVLIAAHADWFIGNNWSTLTANIMEERSVAGKDPRTVSYWGKDKRPLWYGRENEKKENSCLCGERDGAVPYDWTYLPKDSWRLADPLLP